MSVSFSLWPRIAETALAGIVREFPYHPAHTWRDADDGVRPKTLHPIFYGCFDWHSAVHAHWSLAKLLGDGRIEGEVATAARSRLVTALTPEPIAVERAYFEDRKGFEWPYGWAWLFALVAELRASTDPELKASGDALRSLSDLLSGWVQGRLSSLIAPVRTGTHSNTAFALGMMWDAADGVGRPELRDVVAAEAQRLFGQDRSYPWAYEPSAYDFLSPGLATIGLMRRVLDDAAFSDWLEGFGAPTATDLAAIVDLDPTDGWLAHLVGLDLSRAWELGRLAERLPADPRSSEWRQMSEAHRAAGTGALFSGHYEADHWIGTFALYGA